MCCIVVALLSSQLFSIVSKGLLSIFGTFCYYPLRVHCPFKSGDVTQCNTRMGI